MADILKIRRENAAFVQQVANDIRLVRADMTVLAGEMCALKGELGDMQMALGELSRQMQEHAGLRVAFADVEYLARHVLEATRRVEHEHERVQEAMATSSARMQEDLANIRREVNDRLRESQEREGQAAVDMRNVMVQLAARLEDVVAENGRQRLWNDEVQRANEQQQREIAGLKQRVEVLEQDN
jgi:hypothetical protein